jgi:hypothetical protein
MPCYSLKVAASDMVLQAACTSCGVLAMKYMTLTRRAAIRTGRGMAVRVLLIKGCFAG